MKKIIYNILFIFSILFSLFGLLGVVVMISIKDLFGIIFYLAWFCLAGFFVMKIKKKKAHLRSTDFEDKMPAASEAPIVNLVPSESSSISDSITIEELPISNKTASSPILDISSPIEKVIEEDVPIADNVSAALDAPDLLEAEKSFPDTYIAIDIETPNRKNNRISQIGLLLIKDGVVSANYGTLINPECAFDAINTKLTGLDSSTVSRAPKFNQYWPSIEHLFAEYVVVGHNVEFDLNAISKACSSYGLEFPGVQYVCTFVESLNRFPKLEKHSLDYLAAHFEIDLDCHHDANDDTFCCFQLFEKFKSAGIQMFPSVYVPKEVTIPEATTSEGSASQNASECSPDIPYVSDFDFDYNDKKFVLTGVFVLLDKSELIETIESNGGKVMSSVSGRTDYLIVGSEPEPAWVHSSYGRKIEKALTLIDDGNTRLKILQEQTLCVNI